VVVLPSNALQERRYLDDLPYTLPPERTAAAAATNDETTEQLGEGRVILGSHAWLEGGALPATLQHPPLSSLWALRPEKRGEYRVRGRTTELPRWQQAYMRAYEFSGTAHAALPLPAQLSPYLQWANSLGHGPFNGALINWYRDGEDYIGAHSDDTTQLVAGSPVVSISLGAARVFTVRDAATRGRALKRDFLMPDRSFIVMGSRDMQRRYTHEVPKCESRPGERGGPRINITFRQFR
jgi:alkylated DNA repair dioxygenase AlkB